MRKSKLSQYKQSRLIELFVAGTTARTASYYFQRLRQIIYEHSEHLEWLAGEVEAGGKESGVEEPLAKHWYLVF